MYINYIFSRDICSVQIITIRPMYLQRNELISLLKLINVLVVIVIILNILYYKRKYQQ